MINLLIIHEIRLEKEKGQVKGEFDDLKANIDHLGKDKVIELNKMESMTCGVPVVSWV